MAEQPSEPPNECAFSEVTRDSADGKIKVTPVAGRHNLKKDAFLGEIRLAESVLQRLRPMAEDETRPAWMPGNADEDGAKSVKEGREARFESYADQLLGIAGKGLFCEGANPDAAATSLENLKLRVIAVEGRAVKKRQLRKLLKLIGFLFVLFLGAGLTVESCSNEKAVPPPTDGAALPDSSAGAGSGPGSDDDGQVGGGEGADEGEGEGAGGEVGGGDGTGGGTDEGKGTDKGEGAGGGWNWLRNVFYMLAAAVVGIWLSVATRRQQTTFEQLPDLDSMSKAHRIVYVLGFTLILASLCELDVVSIKLGQFDTAELMDIRLVAILFGAICGLSEQMLSTAVAPHATRVIGGLTGNSGENE